MTARDAPPVRSVPARLHWWFEIGLVFVFYRIYSAVRNEFGSAAVEPSVALANAYEVIDVERAMGLFVEEQIQGWFLDHGWFLRLLNIYYGTFHFWVPIAALVFLYLRYPLDYPRWRNTLMIMTGLALVGFAAYPLMPPRLLDACGPFGGCVGAYDFVDTLAVHGGWWSFSTPRMAQISNQFAAMPSLHFGWASWCFLVFYPRLSNPVLKGAIALYPWLTLFAIVVTANHFWIDALGGAVVLAVGYVAGSWLARATSALRGRWASRSTIGASP